MKRYFIYTFILALTLTLAYSQSSTKCQFENCQVCSSLGVCVMCRPNHILQINKLTDSLQCISKVCKIQNCYRCLSDNICAQCKKGFALTSHGNCSMDSQESIKQQIENKICLKSTDKGQCIQCAKGFILNQGKCSLKMLSFALTTSTCITTIVNCQTCLTPNFCITCSTGLIPNAQGNLCIINCSSGSTPVANCLSCATSSACQVCQNGYILESGQCIQCNVPGCQTCSTNNNCSATGCYPGYNFLISSSGYGTCSISNCFYPCNTCDTNGQCISCKFPFNPSPYDNGTCFTCNVQNCAQCGSNNLNICTLCNQGYSLNTPINSTCTWTCTSSNCISCPNGQNTCALCNPGFVPNGAVCSQCNNAPICMSCLSTNLSSCTNCTQGYYLTSSNTCAQCANPSCAVCSGNNGQICTGYMFGLLTFTSTTLINNPNFPYVCDPGCTNCASNFPQTCLQCAAGYYASLISNNIIQCFSCNANCLTCSSSNPSYCYSCFSNAYLVTTSTASTCNTCNPINNCMTCNSDNFNSCTSCPYGYYLTSVTINKSTTNNYCTSFCPANCFTCFPNILNKAICTSCQLGYALTGAGACLPCLSNCRVCSGQSQNICLQCGQGFYLNSNYACTSCSPGCTTCTSTGCLSCASGFNLAVINNNIICSTPCNYPCASCIANQPNKCTSCLFGFNYNSNNQNCIVSNCITNETNNACQYCALGSVFSNGACIVCTSSNCTRCNPTTPSQCTSCSPGFYLNTAGACTVCPPQCGSCSNANTCLTCGSGYTQSVVSSGTNQLYCIACSPPCAQCFMTSETCITCMEGFIFIGWGCVSNFYYTYTATFAAGPTVFFNNYQAFVNRLTYALQTTNSKSLSMQNISSPTAATTNVIVYLSTLQTQYSLQGYTEYTNIEYALVTNVNGQIGGMTVSSSNLTPPNNYITNYYSNVPTLCGILIPLGIFLVVAISYFYCSRNDLDLPGSDYTPPPSLLESEKQAMQMKSI